MFYKKVNKNNNKEMYNFLKNHFEYWTMNSWNRLYSIANNVKIYKLGLDCKILEILELDNYYTINSIIQEWENEHKDYSVGFNGRSAGYLVLGNKDNNNHILDYYITSNDTYEDFKNDIQYAFGGMKYYKDILKRQVEIVQEFDKLCDKLLETCNYMLKNCKIVEKEELITKKFKLLEWA